MQHVEHALQQHVGGGDQGIRQTAEFGDQFVHQALAALAAEGFALVAADFAGKVLQRFIETTGPRLADAELWPRTDQGDVRGLGGEQAAGQLQAGVAVVADH
ncbi:hypothetical protein D3C80_1974550 [compost metagenome]